MTNPDHNKEQGVCRWHRTIHPKYDFKVWKTSCSERSPIYKSKVPFDGFCRSCGNEITTLEVGK